MGYRPVLHTIVLMLTACAAAAAPPVPAVDLAIDRTVPIPPAATHHMGREIAQTMHYTGAPWLVRESRQREEDCRMLVEALAIKPGQVRAELEPAGYAIERQFDRLPWQHLLFFRTAGGGRDDAKHGSTARTAAP